MKLLDRAVKILEKDNKRLDKERAEKNRKRYK